MVSDYGRIFGLPKKTHYGHVMKQERIWSGYMSVCLCRDNKKHQMSVHRIVAKAFVPNPSSKPEVNHLNGKRYDNRASNLEWVTRSENERHAYKVLGKSPTSYWSGKPRAFARRFTDKQVREIRKDSRPSREIAKELGVSKTTILNIRKKKIYIEVV